MNNTILNENLKDRTIDSNKIALNSIKQELIANDSISSNKREILQLKQRVEALEHSQNSQII